MRLARYIALVALVVLFVVSAVSLLAPRAHAQGGQRIDDHLALARVGMSECGLDCPEHELAAIARVLDGRASSIAAGARRYSRRVFDPARTDARAWIADLAPDGHEPRGWYPGVHWSAFRARWLALYERAGRVVRGDVVDRCDGPVDHWGMRHGIDADRARRAGWIEVDCGGTANAFWRVPRRRR